MMRLLKWLRHLLPRRVVRERVIYGRHPRTGLPIVAERRIEARWRWQ